MSILDKLKKSKAKKQKVDAKKSTKLTIAKKKATKTQKKLTKPATAKAAQFASVLHSPHITEKSTDLNSDNAYVFKVSKNANKTQIGQAIQAIYSIKPIAVRIINMKGKKVRYGRIQGIRKNWKKAIVILPKGKTIDVYEGV